MSPEQAQAKSAPAGTVGIGDLAEVCAGAGPSMPWKDGHCQDGPWLGDLDLPTACGFTGELCEKLLPTYNWIIGTNDNTELNLQYVAAYQFDGDGQVWKRVNSSSFNYDGQHPAQDLNFRNLKQADASMFLPPYPGGSANWQTGYTPYPTMPNLQDGEEVVGVAPPAMLFVLKASGQVNDEFSWYVLAQRTINLGAYNGAGCTNPTCDNLGHDNCWSQNSGEIDILEGNPPGADWYPESEVWLNAVNSRGCMMTTADPSKYSASMFKAPIESPLFAAVIDARGVTGYVNPSWEGLGEKTAAATLSTKSPSSAGSTVFIAEAGEVFGRMVDTNQLPGTVAVPHLAAPPPGARRGVSQPSAP